MDNRSNDGSLKANLGEAVTHEGVQSSPELSSRRSFLTITGALAAGAPFPKKVWASDKDTIRVGYISSQTGGLALFGESDNYVVESMRKLLASGLVIGCKKYKVEILQRDDRAASIASKLINSDKVDHHGMA